MSLEYLIEKRIDRIAQHDQALVERLVDGSSDGGAALLGAAASQHRSTLVFFSHPDRAQNQRVHAALSEGGVDIAVRGGRLRGSTHLYNTTDDADRLLAIVRAAMS